MCINCFYRSPKPYRRPASTWPKCWRWQTQWRWLVIRTQSPLQPRNAWPSSRAPVQRSRSGGSTSWPPSRRRRVAISAAPLCPAAKLSAACVRGQRRSNARHEAGQSAQLLPQGHAHVLAVGGQPAQFSGSGPQFHEVVLFGSDHHADCSPWRRRGRRCGDGRGCRRWRRGRGGFAQEVECRQHILLH